MSDDARFQQLNRWLDSCLPELFVAEGWGSAPAELIPASSDASFRRYFRWRGGDRSLVVMDAPPPQEDCRPFVKVAGLLAGAGVHVPRILAQDLENGFLLLSDLGRQTYLDVLHPGNADELFEPALDALIAFQKVDVAGVLPAYDEAVLRRELQLFPDWYLARHLGVELEGETLARWKRICDLLVRSALEQTAGVRPSRLYAAQSDAQRAQPGRPRLPGRPARPGHLRCHLPVQGRLRQLAGAARACALNRYWKKATWAGIPLPPSFEDFLPCQRPDGRAAPPEGDWHLRPYLSPRRQAALPG